jgi:hypothetical protein
MLQKLQTKINKKRRKNQNIAVRNFESCDLGWNVSEDLIVGLGYCFFLTNL